MRTRQAVLDPLAKKMTQKGGLSEMKVRLAILLLIGLALAIGVAVGVLLPAPAPVYAQGGLGPILLPALADTSGTAAGTANVLVQVQNVGSVPTRAALLLYGAYSGFCDPQDPGPQKIECSGWIRPGSAWIWTSEQLPSWMASGIVVAVSECPSGG